MWHHRTWPRLQSFIGWCRFLWAPAAFLSCLASPQPFQPLTRSWQSHCWYSCWARIKKKSHRGPHTFKMRNVDVTGTFQWRFCTSCFPSSGRSFLISLQWDVIAIKNGPSWAVKCMCAYRCSWRSTCVALRSSSTYDLFNSYFIDWQIKNAGSNCHIEFSSCRKKKSVLNSKDQQPKHGLEMIESITSSHGMDHKDHKLTMCRSVSLPN